MKGGNTVYRLLSITLFFISMVMFCFLFPHPVSAATVNWVGGSLGDWNVPGNWSNSALPTSADDVTINGANVTVPAGTTINFNQLTLTNFNSLNLKGNIGTGGSITISNSTLVQQNTVQQIITGTLLIQSGGEIDVAFNGNTSTQANIVNFKASTITLNSGGYIVSNFGDGPGYQGGSGTGNGSGPGGGQGSVPAGAGGGGHGGAGGNGNTGALGGAAYCTIGNISTMGSGGGGGGAGGGAGGGLIILEASGTMTLNGSILVNGGAGAGGTWDGGGAGGGVKLKAAIIAGTPELFTAAGGNGNTNGGGGGGGCVSLTYATSNSINLSQINVTGGTGNHSGGTGLKSISQTINQPPSFSAQNGVSTSTITTSTIPFSWNAGGGTETYYILQRSTDGISYTFVATTSVATTSYTFTGLTPGKGYWLEVASGDGINATSSFAFLGPFYTLANPAGTPTVSSPTTSTLALTINTNGNDATTTYAIYNNTLSTYVAANGSSNGSTPVYFTNANWTGTVTGLSVNTSYQFSVIARNGSNTNAATSSLSTAVYTLANPALAPTIGTPTTSTLPLTLNTNSNPSGTTYAIYNSTVGTYVAASGASNGSTPVYFTSSSWTGTVTSLSLNTSYQFSVIARNGDGVNSATSSLSTATYTLANPALTPTISSPTASTLALALNTNSNPAATTYAIYNNTNSVYVAASGASNGSTPVFFTSSSWTGTVTGLSPNTSYQFSVIARNGGNTNAATSSLSTATYTLANPAIVSGYGAQSTSTFSFAFDTNSNPTITTYAIYNVTSNTYIASNGSSNGGTPIYFTSSSWSGTITGLSINTSYQFSVIARNGDGVNSATSSPSVAFYTYANPALAPTISGPTATTLALAINANSNPSNTTYAIFNNTTGVYVSSNGNPGSTSPSYFTAASWNGTVKLLSVNTAYQFSVVARSGDGMNAATSSLSTATYTLANPALAPTVGTPTTSTLALTINTNSNPSNTTYAIYNSTAGTYVAASGASNGSTPVFFTSASWTGTVRSLTSNTSYQFINSSLNS
jgi:ABC-type phosphate/phosphonate transport system permease subunit